MRVFLVTISTFGILLSCNLSQKPEPQPVKVTAVDSAEKARQQIEKKHLAEMAVKLKLLPIDKAVDSFELRLWVGSMVLPNKLIVLYYKDSMWQTHKIYYYDKQDGSIFRKEEKIKTDFPVTALADSLQLIDFSKMISQHEIKGFEDNVADGVTYHLEIATKREYKCLTYHCPEYFSKTEINNKKFLDLVLLLDKHFGFWSAICAFN
ncbi:MAG: hypothetical protein QM802_17395 [Agriterribacter sp.]